MTKALLIGIGHSFRGDDAIGPMVAESLKGIQGLDVLIHHGEGTDLMERWAGYQTVIIVDATCSGTEPGTIRVWDALADALPAGLFPKGSHVFGLAEGIEMARIMDRLPQAMSIIGIEGRSFTAGDVMTPEVEMATTQAKVIIIDMLSLQTI